MFSKSGQESPVPTRRGPLARLPLWGRGLMAALAVALTYAAVGGPVHVEVVDVGIKDGLAPDGRTHERERWIGISAFGLVGNAIRVNDVPAEAAPLRQLVRAARYAVEKTNVANPSEDPPRADSSLNGVLEEVSGRTPGSRHGLPQGLAMKSEEVKATGLPAWLGGQTIAIIGTVLTVAVGISAMMLVSTAGIRTEIGGIRTEIGGIRTEVGGLRTEMHSRHQELTDQIHALDDRVRKVELTVVAIQSSVDGLGNRVRDVEAHVGESLETAHVVRRPDG